MRMQDCDHDLVWRQRVTAFGEPKLLMIEVHCKWCELVLREKWELPVEPVMDVSEWLASLGVD